VCAGPGHQDVEGGQSLPEEQRIAFWNDVNVPRNIKERLSGALTDVYIQLDNLSKFVELNYDGFRYVSLPDGRLLTVAGRMSVFRRKE
jgi:hypothetical protein